ncbi:glycosyltransferase protein [Spatholobus suberectus]|nr:glycosyltransferase protein [Spatholobus suberectus]
MSRLYNYTVESIKLTLSSSEAMEWFRCPISAFLFPVLLFVISFIFFSPMKERNHLTHLAPPFFLSTIKDNNTNITSPSPPPLHALEHFPDFILANDSHNSTVQSRAIKVTKLTSLEKIEEDLVQARASIQESIRSRNYTSPNTEPFVPKGSIYRNPHAFHQLVN